MTTNGLVQLKKPKHLLKDLTLEEKRSFIESFDYILTDCDGVLWHMGGPIEGVSKATDILQKNGKKINYVSNNSLRSIEGYRDKFRTAGISAKWDDVIHPAVSAVYYLKQKKFNGLIYIMGSDLLKQTIKNAGFDVLDGPFINVGDKCEELGKFAYDVPPVKCVIMDFDLNLTFGKLIRAEMFLRDPECLFLVGVTDDMILINPTKKILGPGSFHRILKNKSPVYIGKPGKGLKDILIDRFQFKNKKRVLFIGDTLEQDIGFGTLCEFQTLCVLSGVTSESHLLNHRIPNEIPDYYCDGIVDFIKLYKSFDQ